MRKLSFLPNELDIFDIRQHYVRILFIFQSLIWLIFLTLTNMNLAVFWNALAVVMTSWIDHVDCVIKRDIYLKKKLLCSKNICGISFSVLKISVVYQEKYIIGVIAWVFWYLKDQMHITISIVWYLIVLFLSLGFYSVSTVFQLFNGDSSQIYVSWTIFNQYLTSSLFWHWQASAIPIILSAKGLLPI